MSETASLEPFQLPQRGFLWTSEVRQQLGISPDTLSHWLTEFPMIKAPAKRSQRRRRFYSEDLRLLARVFQLRRGEGWSIPDIRELLLAELAPAERNRCKKLVRKSYAATSVQTTWRFISDLEVSWSDIARYAGVSHRTARRYLKKREAPYAVGALTELHLRGRVLPNSWNHCFINQRGNLEHHQVGEVSENEIISIGWMRSLHYSEVRSLKRRLSNAEHRIQQLEGFLDEARRQLGEEPSANDP